MRVVVAAVAAAVVLTGMAQAQTATGRAGRDAYVEGHVQSAFGNVTSQSSEIEAGVTVRPRMRVFVELGHVRDSAPEVRAASSPTSSRYFGTTLGTHSGSTYAKIIEMIPIATISSTLWRMVKRKSRLSSAVVMPVAATATAML